jgi:hypothetical protein
MNSVGWGVGEGVVSRSLAAVFMGPGLRRDDGWGVGGAFAGEVVALLLRHPGVGRDP